MELVLSRDCFGQQQPTAREEVPHPPVVPNAEEGLQVGAGGGADRDDAGVRQQRGEAGAAVGGIHPGLGGEGSDIFCRVHIAPGEAEPNGNPQAAGFFPPCPPLCILVCGIWDNRITGYISISLNVGIDIHRYRYIYGCGTEINIDIAMDVGMVMDIDVDQAFA